ncbi:HNH endonuclease family protein [Amycolatopsis palatopharyngis]|uniref:HNH endonuclease family protein n=1 Tax=Amycolatopsis palatopharyngis TaxID=187982 RepID=UPI001FE286B7|nr:HNH endonuclease family protein [Amycolatopsis palatopharyngis]
MKKQKTWVSTLVLVAAVVATLVWQGDEFLGTAESSGSSESSESAAPPAGSGEPPGIPDSDTAKRRLAELAVAPDGSMAGYDREKFPHWSSQGDNCNTREVVLERDGTDVQAGKNCAPTTGNWYSAYDGATWTDPADLDIDHVVPLAAAWRSGASGWTDDRRGDFANDLDGPQLIAVTDNVNQEKGDKSPDQWKPPSVSYWCTYASMWVTVKHKWELTISDMEQKALTSMLGRC